MNDWREDLKRVLLQAGVKEKPTTFLFSDIQVGGCGYACVGGYVCVCGDEVDEGCLCMCICGVSVREGGGQGCV
jgi:P-loop containing dynein motor region D4